MNRKFAKVGAESKIVYAPNVVTANGHVYLSPSAEHYAAADDGQWLPLVSEPPAEKVGVYYTPTEYGDESVLPDGRKVIVRRYDEKPIVAPPPTVTRYSKLKLITAAKAAGKWGKLKEWIAFANLDDEWMACQYVSSDYPEFEDIKAEVASALDMTMAEVDELLAASVDEEVR